VIGGCGHSAEQILKAQLKPTTDILSFPEDFKRAKQHKHESISRTIGDRIIDLPSASPF